MDLTQLAAFQNRVTRSISPESITGEPGMGGRIPLEEGSARAAARDLGTGWKVNPYFMIQPGETLTLADISGEGMINHIWMTLKGNWRAYILRMYWDNEETPSVECPVGDFFCMGWQKYTQLSSLAVCVNPGSGLNCYWQMPFGKRARITLESRDDEAVRVYYQVDYCLCALPAEIAYFHAQFRRVNPLPYKEVYTILDGITGKGHYVGTYMAWGVHNNDWWGEGEIKFYMDGDTDYPTICGTGTEDYFGGAHNFEDPVQHDRYVPYHTPYSGLQVIEPDRLYESQFHFGLYRWHITDPICFTRELRVTIQALGWRDRNLPTGRRYLPLQDDIASVAFWYQSHPRGAFPQLPDRDTMEII